MQTNECDCVGAAGPLRGPVRPAEKQVGLRISLAAHLASMQMFQKACTS